MGPEPGPYSISISADGLSARLRLGALPQGAVTRAALLEALAAAGVRQGVEETALAALLAAPQPEQEVVIARGQSPQDGSDEELVLHFEGGSGLASDGADDAPLDLRQVRNFNNTPAGALLAQKRQASAPRDGWKVTGEPLRAKPGRPLHFKLGKGAVLSSDGTQVLAEVAGHACVVAERIGVLSTVEVPAHVDFSIGNIDFIGSVKVRGNVLPGFCVVAGGDIEIQGNVEKAQVRAGGRLIVRGFVFGQNDCLLEAGGDAQINAADQARIHVHGDLTMGGYLRHCHCMVGGALEMNGQRSSIVGGDVQAFRGISVPLLGNQMATLTRVKVGSNPFIAAQITQLELQQIELHHKAEQLQLGYDAQLKRRAAAAGPETAASDPVVLKLRAALNTIRSQQDEVALELSALQARLAEARDARIRVREIAYPGVLVNFRDHLLYKTQDELQHCCFHEADAEIRIGPY